MNIHVVIPHYRCFRWLDLCLYALRTLADGTLDITIVPMDSGEDLAMLRYKFESRVNSIILHDPGAGVGGMVLPGALSEGVSLRPDSDITITVDPDAIVLRNGWDSHLRAIFSDPRLAVAGINPRSDSNDFAGAPEWNWMAFRTKFWFEHVKSFQWRRTDIGHLFLDAAIKNGMEAATWPMNNRPKPGRPATFVGTPELWAMHAFYSTRRQKDYIPEEEKRGILSYEEEMEIMDICREIIDGEKNA